MKVDLTQILYKKVVRVFLTLCTTSQVVMKNKAKVELIFFFIKNWFHEISPNSAKNDKIYLDKPI